MPTKPDTSPDLALLGLLQLVSPALPIGAFAFSQGLESAFELGWVRDEESLSEWLSGVLEDGLTRCELPVIDRLYGAFADQQGDTVAEWDHWLAATRETAELAAEADLLVAPGDVVMVKGSNGSKASLVAQALANLSRAEGVPSSSDAPRASR